MKKRLLFTISIILFFIAHAAYAVDVGAAKKKTGSGKALAKPVSQGTKDLSAKNITFNFPNANIKDFARFVARLSGKSLIGDNLLKGRINIKSSKKMSLHQVKDVFRTLLNSKALDYTESKIYIEIIPMSASIIEVYELKYLRSVDVAKSLSQMYRMNYRVGTKPENIQITAVKEANSLVVLAPSQQQQEIAESIKKLDVRTRQVLLEIMVVEVTKTDGFGFGLGLQYSDNANTVSLANSAVPFGSTAAQFTTLNIPSAGGYQYNYGNWTMDLAATKKNTKIKVLSQPRAVAAENQKTEIKIGVKQAYINSTTSLGTTGGGNTQTTATNDIGLDITLTPQINKEKNVILGLKFQLTSVLDQYQYQTSQDTTTTPPTPQYSQIPIVGHRIINNTSTVKSGQTLVIGGLLENQKTVTTTAPPFLGDLPLIGWAFSEESELSTQTELLIFIKPTVINNTKEGRLATKSERDKLKNFDEEETDTIDQMLTGRKAPTDNAFDLYDYFTDEKYRQEQDFIPHTY